MTHREPVIADSAQPSARAQTAGSTPRRGGTHERLLTAGRRLFAQRGFDGASIRAITRAAGANLGGVTYHFGSKKALYQAVLDHVLSPLGERVERAGTGAGGTLDRLEHVVRAFFEHLRENPDMPQLMLQEIAAGKSPPTPVRRVLGRTSGTLVQLVIDGQRAGEIREGDPLLLALSCVYQPVHLTLVRRMANSLLGLDMADPETYARVVEHSVDFVRSGLERRKEMHG